MAVNTAEAGRSVTSKITSILLTFTRGNEHSLTEIARLAGLPISTAHRLIAELSRAGGRAATVPVSDPVIQVSTGIPVSPWGRVAGLLIPNVRPAAALTDHAIRRHDDFRPPDSRSEIIQRPTPARRRGVRQST